MHGVQAGMDDGGVAVAEFDFGVVAAVVIGQLLVHGPSRATHAMTHDTALTTAFSFRQDSNRSVLGHGELRPVDGR